MTSVSLDRKKQIDQLIQEEYAGSCPQMKLKFPWVLVYVCKKEQIRNGVILPDIEQNKTIHEGIVLATWEPCRRFIGKYVHDVASELQPGNRVVFPHWAGVPMDDPRIVDSRFRIVRETHWSESSDGGIFAVLDSAEEDTFRQLEQLIDKTSNTRLSNTLHVINKLLEKFVVVDKEIPSITLSGR